MGELFSSIGGWSAVVFFILCIIIIALVVSLLRRIGWAVSLGSMANSLGQRIRRTQPATMPAPTTTPATPPARTPTTNSNGGYGWIFRLAFLAGLAFCAWYAYKHWDEWFPSTVQCSVVDETKQDCVMKPHQGATFRAPSADPTRNLQICLVLGTGKPGELESIWYMDNTSFQKKVYNVKKPPSNVTSYWFQAGPEGATVTYYLAEKSC